MTGVGHCDAAGGEQEDALADALLVSIDREGATSDEINSTLRLVGLHHREIEDDGLAFPQSLNGPRHFIKAAGFHHIHLGRSIADAGHADHVGSRQITTEIKRVGVTNGC